MYDGSHSIQIIPESLIMPDSSWAYNTYNDGMWINTGELAGINTWKDWYLIPDERPSVSMPPLKEDYLEIPAYDGAYDLTEIISGRPVYSNRTGSWSFYVDNDHAHWATIYSKIANYAHGKRVRVVLMDDPGFFYEGRIKVNNWSSEETNSKISIDYTLAPYKRESIMSLMPWLWSPFNFETGVIRDYTSFEVSSNQTVKVEIARPSIYRVVPEFDIVGEGSLTIGVGTETTMLKSITASGTNVHIVPPSTFNVYTGCNWIWLVGGSGTVRIFYRGGCL